MPTTYFISTSVLTLDKWQRLLDVVHRQTDSFKVVFSKDDYNEAPGLPNFGKQEFSSLSGVEQTNDDLTNCITGTLESPAGKVFVQWVGEDIPGKGRPLYHYYFARGSQRVLEVSDLTDITLTIDTDSVSSVLQEIDLDVVSLPIIRNDDE